MASPVATHSMIFVLRRTAGSAHTLSGSQACFSSRSRRKNPSPRNTAVPPRKYGRSGSNVAEIPAPDTPTVTASSGPAQQSAEPNAVATPPTAVITVLIIYLLSPSAKPRAERLMPKKTSEHSILKPVPWYGVKTYHQWISRAARIFTSGDWSGSFQRSQTGMSTPPFTMMFR